MKLTYKDTFLGRKIVILLEININELSEITEKCEFVMGKILFTNWKY